MAYHRLNIEKYPKFIAVCPIYKCSNVTDIFLWWQGIFSLRLNNFVVFNSVFSNFIHFQQLLWFYFTTNDKIYKNCQCFSLLTSKGDCIFVNRNAITLRLSYALPFIFTSCWHKAYHRRERKSTKDFTIFHVFSWHFQLPYLQCLPYNTLYRHHS